MRTDIIVGLSVIAAIAAFSAYVFVSVLSWYAGFWAGVRAGVYRTATGDREWFELNSIAGRDCGEFNFSLRPLRRLVELTAREGGLVTVTADRIVYAGRDGIFSVEFGDKFGDDSPEAAVIELYRKVEPNAAAPEMPDRPKTYYAM